MATFLSYCVTALLHLLVFPILYSYFQWKLAAGDGYKPLIEVVYNCMAQGNVIWVHMTLSSSQVMFNFDSPGKLPLH